MTLAYGWVTKTQKRISDALVSGKLTKWEMAFIQSIDIKLETYKTDSRFSDEQHQRLIAILSKGENPKARDAHPSSPSGSSFDLQTRNPARHDGIDQMSDADERIIVIDLGNADVGHESPGSPTVIYLSDV